MVAGDPKLTTHGTACPKDPSYLWVKMDHHVIGLLDLLISNGDLTFNPLSERLLDDRIDDIDKVITRHLKDFSGLYR